MDRIPGPDFQLGRVPSAQAGFSQKVWHFALISTENPIFLEKAL